ncbi:MAG: ABC transporter permease [Gordonia sp. (in: high G+C Gram-positive bacteria)]
MNWIRTQRWWLTRVLVFPLHLLVFVIITFVLVRAMPADPVRELLGTNYTPQAYAKLKTALGLDGSTWHQLVEYLKNLAHFDLGTSISTSLSVRSQIGSRLPNTVELSVLGLGLTIVASLIASYVAVIHSRSVLGRIIRGYSAMAGALPEYVIAVIGLLVFYAFLHWSPPPLGLLSPGQATPRTVTGFPLLDALIGGNLAAFGDEIHHLILPAVVLAVANSALLIKLLIVGLEEGLNAAPTRFRIATGSRRRTVLVSIYRRAAPPVVTMCGIMFGYMLGGVVILESLFGFTGVGAYAVDAVNSGDFIALQGFLLVVAALSMLVFLLTDLINMAIDPRRRSAAAGAIQ